jgi:hypothetical protein
MWENGSKALILVSGSLMPDGSASLPQQLQKKMMEQSQI